MAGDKGLQVAEIKEKVNEEIFELYHPRADLYRRERILNTMVGLGLYIYFWYWFFLIGESPNGKSWQLIVIGLSGIGALFMQRNPSKENIS